MGQLLLLSLVENWRNLDQAELERIWRRFKSSSRRRRHIGNIPQLIRLLSARTPNRPTKRRPAYNLANPTRSDSAASSGNKLSHLDGDLLLPLSQLHSIQLAANKWRCDCKLRKLVRRLTERLVADAGLGAQQPRASILQDEPQCFLRWHSQPAGLDEHPNEQRAERAGQRSDESIVSPTKQVASSSTTSLKPSALPQPEAEASPSSPLLANGSLSGADWTPWRSLSK